MTLPSATIIDGKVISAEIRIGLKARVAALKAKGIVPRLDVILIGDHPASVIYVNTKQKAAKAAGIECIIHRFDKDIMQQEAEAQIAALNRDAVHGILLQLPVPKHLDTHALLNAIDYRRDVDGLTDENVKRRQTHKPSLLPCTPKGCIKLIKTVQQNLSGLKAVVVGRSNLVGKPMAELLEREGCVVESVHKETPNPAAICRTADILVVAIGVSRHINADWIKPGAIVIDVGINRIGETITGDVNFNAVKAIARAITPVPGGVGPMTVTCLLENVIEVAEGRYA
jgi:methylenetetrahydrofolate dehydrogenase (NADP+) / methenyltetrahydrofolate cyclohydrolase